MGINQKDMPKIEAVSRADVELTLAGLRQFIRKRIWVGATNRYLANTTKTIEAELRAGQAQAPQQLAQYVAASTLLHCADGWSYLGKSIISLLRGDPHRALHLAYYAELRAAISL